MAGTVALKVVSGPLAGRAFEFTEHDTFIFGRAPDCHAALPPGDMTASRHHFLLEANPPLARLRDLGSLNGTFVNGNKWGGRLDHETPEQGAARSTQYVDIQHGDRINVGATRFLVEITVPPVCTVCGGVIDSTDLTDARSPDGTLRCARCRVTVQAPIDEPNVARAANQYERGRLLGKGGMGAVYLARRLADNRQVAIKTMLPKVAVDPKARTLFLREIEVARSLSHPNIVTLLEHGEGPDGFYFVMEYCSDGNLDDLRIRRGGRLEWPQAVRLTMQALEGLSAAHAQGFVHRDIKPQNVLLREGATVAKVSDFGLAKSFERAGFSGFTAVGAVGGTFVFMAREQLTSFKFAKPVSDVWSMGAVLYVLLTGQPPRAMRPGDDPVEVVLNGQIVPISTHDRTLPPPLATAIDHALAVRAGDRFQTAAEFRDALAAALDVLGA